MSPRDVNNGDVDQENPLPEEFEDDLNEDWESAFKSDDFMFSQDDETADLFAPGRGGEEDIDLSSLTVNKAEEDPSPDTAKKKESEPEEIKRKRFLDFPQWQRVVILAAPILTVAAVALFFLYPGSTRTPPALETTAEKKQAEETTPVPEKTTAQSPPTTAENKKNLALSPSESAALQFQPIPATAIRKRYNLPSIFITAANKDDEAIFVSVDITLLLKMAPEQALTEKEKIKASDIIYQYFKNRPAEELEDYALSRGKMIQGIRKWVRQNWPQGPLQSIIVNRYSVSKS